jgi:riboflavin kinase
MHPLNEINLIGKVVSGRGEGRKYLALAWVKQQLTEKLGFTPFAGTLNLQLDAGSVKQKNQLNKNTAHGICQSTGYCAGLLFKASIVGLDCAVVIPQVKHYPDELLEVVAAVDLRRELRLHDGDDVEVTVLL